MRTKTIVPLSKPLKVKVQKRDNICKEYENITMPDSPVKPIKAQFMMTGMTCVATERNKEIDSFATTIKTMGKTTQRDEDSRLSPGCSPLPKTIYGIPFRNGRDDTALKQH